jgi:hypothetical protein
MMVDEVIDPFSSPSMTAIFAELHIPASSQLTISNLSVDLYPRRSLKSFVWPKAEVMNSNETSAKATGKYLRLSD